MLLIEFVTSLTTQCGVLNHDALLTADGHVTMGDVADFTAVPSTVVAHGEEWSGADLVEGLGKVR